MSFIAELLIDGSTLKEAAKGEMGVFEELEILECDYFLTQDIDHTGKPMAMPKGGIISLQVPSTKNTEFFTSGNLMNC
mgnify:CR=1 FL=1